MLPQPLRDLVARCERETLAEHPLLRSLARAPVDLRRLHLLLRNARPFAGQFPSWLAHLIARSPDDVVRSRLAGQLHDELGRGQPERVHGRLYDALLAALPPLDGLAADALRPGRELLRRAALDYVHPDPSWALGALVIGELHALQFNAWLGAVLRQCHGLAEVPWQADHAEAEARHLADSLGLLADLPEEALLSAARGGAGVHDSLLRFLDAVSDIADGAGPDGGDGDDAAPLSGVLRPQRRTELAAHPLFQRLRRGPFEPGAVWLLLANMHEASRDFIPWLAGLVGRLDDGEARAILAGQLYDELGRGDATRRHSVLFSEMLEALAPLRPPGPSSDRCAPGRRLRQAAGAVFCSPDPYVGLGASAMGELYAQQFDALISEQLRRGEGLAPPAWLTTHEELEGGHVDDSLRLLVLLPQRCAEAEAARLGAEETGRLFLAFLDEVEQELERLPAGGGRRPG